MFQKKVTFLVLLELPSLLADPHSLEPGQSPSLNNNPKILNNYLIFTVLHLIRDKRLVLTHQ